MAFEGFTVEDIATRGAMIHILRRGVGPPLVLLHGFPQAHFIWHKIGERLFEQYTVVLTDLRGYGDSAEPEGGGRHRTTPFGRWRRILEVMRHLGHERFFVASHDRGARTAHRMCLDHPQAIRKVCFMEIVPTLLDVSRYLKGVRHQIYVVVLSDSEGSASRTHDRRRPRVLSRRTLEASERHTRSADGRGIAGVQALLLHAGSNPRELRGFPSCRGHRS
jgi:pimeloyl-ACP methyl ester carboxylesterase